MVGHPQGVLRHDLQGEIAEGLSDSEGVLARLNRAVMVPYLPSISAHKGRDPPQPWLVAEALGTGATTITTACPFCMTMLTDGVKAAGKTDTVAVRDLAEIVADTI